MEESKENFKKIKSANQMMLDYFNKSFLSQLEDIQNLKTQIFEIDIKIDELDKTKDIYAFKTNSRKSVFSPVTNDGVDTERNKIIQEQIKDLQSVKETLTLKLRCMELQLNKLRQYLEALNNAEDALTSFEPRYTTDDPDHTDHYGFTFLQEDAKEDISSHGYNILMLSICIFASLKSPRLKASRAVCNFSPAFFSTFSQEKSVQQRHARSIIVFITVVLLLVRTKL